MRSVISARAPLAALVVAAVLGTAGGSRQNELEDQIDRILAASFDPQELGAAAIVIEDGSVILRKGYGLADLELGVPVRPEMVYRIGSETKSFTAVAVMALVERGALSLDDAIRQHLPELPERFDSVSIRQLLSHTS